MDTDVQSSSPVGKHLSREQIMHVTARLLREAGYDKTTIRGIAKRLDCAVGSIYRYFADKRELLFAVAESALEPASALVEAGGSVEQSAREYHRLAGRDPALYRLMFWLASVIEAGKAGEEGRDEADAGAVESSSSADGKERAGVESNQSSDANVATAAVSESARVHHPPLPPPSREGDLSPDRRRQSRLPLAGAAPAVVRRLINGWGRRLGDANLAARCWMTLHGCVMLGASETDTLTLLGGLLAEPAGRKRPAKAATQQPAAPTQERDESAVREKATVREEEDAAARTVNLTSPDQADDVCLL